MTQEEIKQYTSENEPAKIIRDVVGRWVKRIWKLESSQIEESYIYKYDADLVAVNTDITKYRDSYTVLSTELKEVQNG